MYRNTSRVVSFFLPYIKQMVFRDSVQSSMIISLIVQLIIFAISVKTQFIRVESKDIILKDALFLENIVQFVEICFYVWFATILAKQIGASNIARYRYMDWILTTPTMILSTIAYFHYNNIDSKTGFRIHEFAKSNWKTICKLFAYNWCMLLVGYLQELNVISVISSTIVGFTCFGLLFYGMYHNYASLSLKNVPVFTVMFLLWASYGIVSLNSNKTKNILYNVLDVFSKNFYGLFLVYTIRNLEI